MKEQLLVAELGRAVGLPMTIDEGNVHVVTAGLVALVLVIAALIAWIKLRDTEKNLIPSDKLSISSMFEVVVELVLGFMEGVMGRRAKQFLPLIGATFIYIFACNVVGVIPGILPPTSNVNTNLACALCVFVYYNYVGIRAHGVRGYLKHLAGPVLWLAPLMLTIEVVSHLVRPVSLSVRLFGNMMGDHMVLGIFSDLVPFAVPVIFMALAVFVSFIQAFVFSLLSTIYIALATEGEGK